MTSSAPDSASNVRTLRPSVLVQKMMHLGGKRFDISQYPYLGAIYDSQAREMLLRTGRQVAKCARYDSPVTMADGSIKKLGEVQLGEYVLSIDAQGQAISRPVIGCYNNGVAECVRVITERGFQMEVTPHHRLLGPLGYIEAGSLVPGDLLMRWKGHELRAEAVENVTPIGPHEVFDLEVLGEHNYLLDGGVVSHNSTTIASKMVSVAITHPHGSQVLVTPLQDQAFVFSTQRLTDFLERSPVIRAGYFNGPDIINQTLKKRLTNHHLISLGYAQRTADRLRGQSVKTALNYDEVQDIYPDVIPVINELAFRYPDCKFLYSGTPKSGQNHMEAMHERSTGAEWAVKCQHGGCNHWNMTWDETNIGELGVVCSKCRQPINTNLGQWVVRRKYGSVKNNRKILMEAYRIPQLIVKPIMDHPVKWDELLTKFREYPNAQFRNEVLGMAADCGSQPITLSQLAACCESDRRNELPLLTSATARPPALIMGVDWAVNGAVNDGNSHTAVVIGGWNPFPARFDVLYYKIFMGAESGPEYEMDWIIRMVEACGINLVAADWGSGMVQNITVSNAIGAERLVQMWHAGNLGAGSSKAPRAIWNAKTCKYHLARTRVLTDTFESLRNKQVRLPRQPECEPFFAQILAEAMEYNDKSNTLRYVNIKPDDCLHALTYAMIGSELYINGDFRGHTGSIQLPTHASYDDPEQGGLSDEMLYGN
jgi:hypothetical protein